MQIKTTKIVLVSAVFFGLIFCGSFLLVTYAQKQTSNSKEMENSTTATASQEQDARDKIDRSIVGNFLLDKIAVQDSDWKLSKSSFTEKTGDRAPETVSMIFIRDNQQIYVGALTFSSEEEAVEAFRSPRSYGGGVKAEGFGDLAEKIYGQDGKFIGVSFQKGLYRVTVRGSDEGDTEKFAVYMSDIIGNLSGK